MSKQTFTYIVWIIVSVSLAVLVVHKLWMEFPAATMPRAIRYNELEHNRRWEVFVDVKDTTYFDGCLFIFDTVTLEYKRVATVIIQPIKNNSESSKTQGATTPEKK
jgi:hypothetical protein